ncbi:MAG: hypothetical protein JWM75_2361 [Sphingomonas bacterium]|nr:hypothetical protein [Sphingomonas bacterium]
MSKLHLIRVAVAIVAAAALGATAPAHAQMRTVDPSAAMQAESSAPPRDDMAPVAVDESDPAPPASNGSSSSPSAPAAGDTRNGSAAATRRATPNSGDTFQDDDVFAAAEGVFGKGARDLAALIEKVLKDQGRPNAYIEGREGGGAFAVGVRYGSGTMHHKVEGDIPVYWTGPSVGLDIGANGSKSFVLVYNLYDSNDLFERFPSGEAAAYVVGGFTASYMRRGDVVLIPIRLGVGWRLGANVGYTRFSRTSKWLPF